MNSRLLPGAKPRRLQHELPAPRGVRSLPFSRESKRGFGWFSTASQRHGSAPFPRPTRGAGWRFAVGKPKGILKRKRFLRAVPCRLSPAHGAASAGGSVQAGSPAEGRSSSSRAGFQHSHEFQPQPRPPQHPSFETAGGGSEVTHKPCQGGLVLAARHCSQLRAEEETRELSAGAEGITPPHPPQQAPPINTFISSEMRNESERLFHFISLTEYFSR